MRLLCGKPRRRDIRQGDASTDEDGAERAWDTTRSHITSEAHSENLSTTACIG